MADAEIAAFLVTTISRAVEPKTFVFVQIMSVKNYRYKKKLNDVRLNYVCFYIMIMNAWKPHQNMSTVLVLYYPAMNCNRIVARMVGFYNARLFILGNQLSWFEIKIFQNAEFPAFVFYG